jgi:hypothetical protein
VTRTPTRPPASTTSPVRGRPPGPDAARLATLLVRAWLEVRSGHRPLEQLAPLVTPAVHRRLAATLPAHPKPTRVARVHKVRATHPTPSTCEACVTVAGEHGRLTAIAIRLERHLGVWRVTEMMAPEAGLPPLTTASLPEGYRPRDAFDEILEEEWR